MARRPSPAEAIFLALADLSPVERDAFLHERCAGNDALRAEVDAMLQSLDAPHEEFLDPGRIPAIDTAALEGPLKSGAVLGDVFVLHAIGSGGMGVVYAAQQDRPRRTVAVKVLHRDLRHPAILKRFAREADVLARLEHPGIAQVFAFHPGDRTIPAHLVMELVDGPPITEYAQAFALDLPARLELMIRVCEAVQHAHGRGIIHRDLKPANVLVTGNGQPKVLDFGIARVTGLGIQSTIGTSHGEFLGTLVYMSPEQLRGATDQVDARSDVYALGMLLYRLVARTLPFDIDGLSLVEAAQRILHTEIPPLGSFDRRLSGSIEQIASRALCANRTARYQTAADLAADLRASLEGRAPALSPEATLPSSGVIVAESPGQRCVAVGLPNGTLVVLDSATGSPLLTRRGSVPLVSITFPSDGQIALGRADGSKELVPLSALGRS